MYCIMYIDCVNISEFAEILKIFEKFTYPGFSLKKTFRLSLPWNLFADGRSRVTHLLGHLSTGLTARLPFLKPKAKIFIFSKVRNKFFTKFLHTFDKWDVWISTQNADCRYLYFFCYSLEIIQTINPLTTTIHKVVYF